MDPEPMANLLAVLIWLGGSCLRIGLPLAGGAALAAERGQAQAELDRQAADLRPWSAAALSDLSTDWDATGGAK